MNHLRRSLPLILIALVLLLSDGSLAQTSRRPSQSLPQQTNNESQNNQTYSGQWTGTWTQSNAPSRESSAQKNRSDSDQNPSWLWKIWEWIGSISAEALFTAITGIATVVLAVFTGQLVCVSRDLHQATEAALHVNRPFLLVTHIKCTETIFAEGILRHRFIIHLKNFGVGPADIVKYLASANIHDTPLGVNPKEPTFRYFPENGQRLADSLVAPTDTSDRIECRSLLIPEMYAAILNGTKTLAVDGIVVYRGASPKTYETRFFWWCYLDNTVPTVDPGEPTRFMRALRPDLNEHT